MRLSRRNLLWGPTHSPLALRAMILAISGKLKPDLRFGVWQAAFYSPFTGESILDQMMTFKEEWHPRDDGQVQTAWSWAFDMATANGGHIELPPCDLVPNGGHFYGPTPYYDLSQDAAIVSSQDHALRQGYQMAHDSMLLANDLILGPDPLDNPETPD